MYELDVIECDVERRDEQIEHFASVLFVLGVKRPGYLGLGRGP